MKADARAHPHDEVADDEGDDLNGVDGVRAKPENAGHGTNEGKANQERVVNSLLESGTADQSAAWLDDNAGPAGTGDRQFARSNSVESLSPKSLRETVSRASMNLSLYKHLECMRLAAMIPRKP